VNLFDSAEAQRRKEAGMAAAAAARPELLAVAKDVANRICRAQGVVTSDDVAFRMAELGYQYERLGNAAGSVFRGEFAWTGNVIASERASTHGRMIRVWKLKEETNGRMQD
jgi:hypothetical protein